MSAAKLVREALADGAAAPEGKSDVVGTGILTTSNKKDAYEFTAWADSNCEPALTGTPGLHAMSNTKPSKGIAIRYCSCRPNRTTVCTGNRKHTDTSAVKYGRARPA